MSILLPQLSQFLTTGRCILCKEPLVGLYSGTSTLSRSGVCPRCIEELAASRIGTDVVRCKICGLPLISEEELCLRCRTRNYRFDLHRALFSYQGIVRKLIHEYKFSGHRSLAILFSLCIAESMSTPPVPIVPVPAHRGRRRRRGWEHVEEISRILQREHRFEILPLLVRAGGRAQKSLDFEGRRANMEGRILLHRDETGRGLPQKIVLIDDVFTTGATLDECAAVLKAGGVEHVEARSIAMD